MQIAMHAVGKITLFFCAGAIYVAAHKTEVSELSGLGRAMPITFAAFLIGALSIIGLPPFGGLWSKWYPGARRARGAPDRHRRGADDLLAAQHRLSAADPAAGLLRQAAGQAGGTRRRAASRKRRLPA